ncbi:hypothetical protein LOAG_14363 [Loa loa]|uniref:Ovule protein n=1 Tax=Loa loa TaxID=7209 RepID=A0A1I7W282_LOALO|nr:hypothetical protein LOAG_14363 [Loa loa]EFO14161.1 hypothetical protein LOAG_14363 [Loa loa]
MATRISRSVDLKKEKRKECAAQKKSKSSTPTQNKMFTSKDKKTKAMKVIKASTVAIGSVNDLLQSTKTTGAKFASTSSATTSASIAKRSEAVKMTAVKMNSSPSLISGELSKHSLLWAGQRPSTTSIKNRTSTPKPGLGIYESGKSN